MIERCVCCGAEIPEGRQVCKICEFNMAKIKRYTLEVEVQTFDIIGAKEEIAMAINSVDCVKQIKFKEVR